MKIQLYCVPNQLLDISKQHRFNFLSYFDREIPVVDPEKIRQSDILKILQYNTGCFFNHLIEATQAAERLETHALQVLGKIAVLFKVEIDSDSDKTDLRDGEYKYTISTVLFAVLHVGVGRKYQYELDIDVHDSNLECDKVLKWTENNSKDPGSRFQHQCFAKQTRLLNFIFCSRPYFKTRLFEPQVLNILKQYLS